MRSPLAYRPRPRPLQLSSPSAALTYLGGMAIAAFLFSNPVLLASATVAACLAGLLAGVGAAVRFALKIGLLLALLLVLVNGLVVERGSTVLLRLGDWPLPGRVDVTLEALMAGAVIGLRAMAVMVIAAVYSAAVDPDRVLRALRPWLARSAMTAGLASRLLPLSFADAQSLSETARLRGPGAAPVGRGPLARRLLAGSLDRAIDVAATLELRGYALSGHASERFPVRIRRHLRRLVGRRHDRYRPPQRSRFNTRFFLCGTLIAAISVSARLAGIGGFDVYPTVELAFGPAEAAIATGLILSGLAPMRVAQVRGRWR